MHHWSKV